MEEIVLTIDGKEARGSRGDTILAVCERNGIAVPTLCHFKGLTDIGACRLCIVEIEGARGLNTACTTPASSGMVVRTDTPNLKALRKSTLELLFAERNHLCPFCEMSGDCELQALGYKHGIDAVRYAYMHPKLGLDSTSPYFVLDHNRCVLCRRCVRACAEVAGANTLGYRERGASTRVNFDLDSPAGASTCESCGVCVQVCPTGAFFDKRSAYKGRLAECEHVATACQACGMGCRVTAVSRGRSLLRIEGDFDREPSFGLLCMRGRYEALATGKQRILTPMVRRDGILQEATWDEALDLVAQRIGAARSAGGGKKVGAVATAAASSEALYLLDWVFRGGVGGKVVVHGANQAAARAAALRRLTGGNVTAEAPLAAVRKADFTLLLGAEPATTHPVIAGMLRRAVVRGGARLAIAGSQSNPLAPYACATVTPKPGSEGILVNGLMRAVLAVNDRPTKPLGLESALHRYTPELVQAQTSVSSEDLRLLAKGLVGARYPLVLYGGPYLGTADLAASAVSLAMTVGHMVDGRLPAIGLAEGANSVAAARLAGGRGLGELAAVEALFVALGDDGAGDLAEKIGNPAFLAVQAAYPSSFTEKADVVLPAPLWYERRGSFVASDGSPRRAERLIAPPSGMMDDLELIAALGARLGAAASFTESALAAKVGLALAMPAANLDRAAPVSVAYL